MYPQFFGFTKLPFRLRPDPEFIYPGITYQTARSQLLLGLEGDSRLIVLRGAAGVGKTLLLDDVLEKLPARFLTCRVNQPRISATELLQALLLQLGRAAAGSVGGRARLLGELFASIEALEGSDMVALLVIDDAQLLSGATVGVLSELADRAPRLKILLAGRLGPSAGLPEITAKVQSLAAGLQVGLSLLDARESKAYIEHRLSVAGSAREVFASEAHALLFQETGGAARLINVLCDGALHLACARASGYVQPQEILDATQDVRWSEAVARSRATDATAPSTAGPRLSIAHRGNPCDPWPVKSGCLSIGRALDNELRLDEPCISRHHCQLTTVGDVSTIEDLGSVNGIFVNGIAVKRQVLQHADQITVGEHVLTFLAD